MIILLQDIEDGLPIMMIETELDSETCKRVIKNIKENCPEYDAKTIANALGKKVEYKKIFI